MTTEQVYRCKGCGEDDTIEEIGVVPRTMRAQPDGDGIKYVDWTDKSYFESESFLGYGCSNVMCEHWQGMVGIEGVAPNLSITYGALSITDIADVIDIEDTGVNPEAGNPALYYPIQ